MTTPCMFYELCDDDAGFRANDAGFRANDAGFHVFDRIA